MKTAFFSEYPILIVDDEAEVIKGFELILNSGGFGRIIPCRDSREVLNILEETGGVEVILLDLMMPFVKGQDLLPVLSEKYPEIAVIVITADDDLDTAVQCMKQGAFDYLVKPVEKMRLLSSVRRAVEMGEAARENRALKKRILSDVLEHPEAFENIITRNSSILAIFRYIEAVAVTSEPVLITGETGVGKELIARAVHRLSGLTGPFLAVNIAGQDDQRLSDVLFGHKKGAFTGADANRDGLVKKAGGGTLFLDEIGDLSNASQVKLLRLLQEGEYFALGSDLPRKSSARILAASNRNLSTQEAGTNFRRDLYYRLQTHQVHLPPLKERMEDLPLLVDHFLEKAAGKLGKKKPSYPEELITLLRCHNFPGNIRELETMVFNALSSHKSGILSLETFKERIFVKGGFDEPEQPPEGNETIFSLFETLPTLEQSSQELIREAMKRANNNQSMASRFLGISQPALSRRLKYSRNR